MLAYAPRPHREAPHPRTLILIIAGHLFALGAVVSAKLDLPARFHPTETQIVDVPVLQDPPPLPSPHPKIERPVPSPQPMPQPQVDTKPVPVIDPFMPGTGPVTDGDGSGLVPGGGDVVPPPVHQVVRVGPRIATAEDQLRPPYPASKRELGEETTLQLRLTIDERGRVTAVDPIGRADPAFLASARAHIIRAWRFEPATEDGKPVASTKTISLRFQLGEA